jgi:ribosomal protein S14
VPIRPALRWLYPIDWPQISQAIRFGRAGGHCEHCARPHGATLRCLPDGRWQDPRSGTWRDGRGRQAKAPAAGELAALRLTRVVLAAAHLDHDPTNNRRTNLRSLCQRCHMLHDQLHHLAQRRITLRRRWALGDLFGGTYPRN